MERIVNYITRNGFKYSVVTTYDEYEEIYTTTVSKYTGNHVEELVRVGDKFYTKTVATKDLVERIESRVNMHKYAIEHISQLESYGYDPEEVEECYTDPDRRLRYDTGMYLQELLRLFDGEDDTF